MKSILYKILSILLIPVVLFSTTSFNVEKHICMDSFYSISISGEAEDCGMEIKKCDEKVSNYYTLSEENCCKNEIKMFTGSIVNREKEISFNLKQSYFSTLFIISREYLFKSNLNKSNVYKYYPLPIVTKNISILYQVFKI